MLFRSCISFGCAGTGGFGVLNSSLASYTPLQQVITAVFMVLFGVNFTAYFYIISKKLKLAFGMEEVRVYLGVIAASVVLISINTYRVLGSALPTVRHAFIQVASIITTSGFSTVDFNAWPMFSKGILVILMFIGACAGSTGGGLKVSRVIVKKYVRRIDMSLSFSIQLGIGAVVLIIAFILLFTKYRK